MGLGDGTVLTCQRDQFSIPDGLHYLNCAYMGPLPRVAEEAGIVGLRMKRDPSLILPHHFFDTSLELRTLFARLVGAGEPSRISIGPGVSYAVAVAARNLPLSSGQNVVLTHEQFPANVHAWARKTHETRARSYGSLGHLVLYTGAPPGTHTFLLQSIRLLRLSHFRQFTGPMGHYLI